MLTPDYLDALPQPLVALMEQVEEDILQDVARRIGKLGLYDPLTEGAEWQLWRYEQIRALRSEVVKRLAKASGKTEAYVRKLLQQAGLDTLASDDDAYRAMGFDPPGISTSPALLNLLNAGYRQTMGSWRNLTATTANTVTKQFEDALDRAWLQVSSGAFDYKTAVKRSVDDLAQHMKFIEYPSGHRDTLEVAVRRAVLTGVNQTAGKLQLERMDQMAEQGFGNFVEVSAHTGARSDGSGGAADHAAWQGKVYHRGGRIYHQGEWYEDFEAATGYGTGEGLCGWNCRHNFHPFWPGISKRNYTDEQLAAMNEANVPYNGKLYTRYEINQMQRALERKVRSAKRKYLAESAAGVDASRSAVRLKAARQQLNNFIRTTGGRADSSRTSVAGFGRSEASKATWAAKKAQTAQPVQNRNKGTTHRKAASSGGYVISQPLYSKLVKPVLRAGGLVLRGTPEVEAHLKAQGASASTIGDVLMFRKDATTSDVLEEVHHFWQTRSGLNSEKPLELRTILNEIDAKEYLISVADRYKIPVEETELTRLQLEEYRIRLQELEKGGG